MHMSLMINTKFQCFNIRCQPFNVTTVSDTFNCQILCLAQEQCRTINFWQLTGQCELFAEVPGNNGTLMASVGSIVMVVIYGARLSSS